MLSRKELKTKAKESLSGHWVDAIGIILLLSVIPIIGVGLVEVISHILSLNEGIRVTLEQIVSILISGLLTMGYTNFFLKISRDEDVEISELWSKTHMFIPFIVVSILVTVFTTLWTLLLIIPGIIAAFSYSFVYYVMLDNEEMSAMKVIKESKRILKGHKFDLFVLQLSFIGWSILGIFTLGILYFWLIPYMSVTTCNFYNNIKELS